MIIIFVGALCTVSGIFFLIMGFQDEEPMVKRSKAIQTIKQAYIKGWADGAEHVIDLTAPPKELTDTILKGLDKDLTEFEKIITIE